MHSIETWRAFVDALPDAAVVLSAGSVAFLNQAASKLFGVGPEEPLTLERLFPGAEERARLVAAAAGEPLELVCCGPAGARFLADVRTRVMEGSEPPLRLCVVRELMMSAADQARCRSAVELFELGLFEHDHVTDELWASAGHRKLYGRTPDEELTIPKLLAGLHPEDFGLVAPAIARAHDPAGDGRFDVEHRVIWPNGEIHWVRSRSQTVFAEIDGERRALRTVGASADQTARKETERDRERIVAVLEETPDFVAIAAPDRSLLYLNRSARTLLGVADDEDLSRLKLGDHHTAASRDVLLRTVLPAAERDGVWSGDATLIATSGREVPVSLVALAHFRGDDSVERYSTVARDLSREKELEEQLLQSQKMEALGRMAGGAAHDFNNLLSVIIGGTDLALARIPTESPLQELLEGVLDASKRATELTQQMLTFSRKSVSRPRVVVDVNDVIERMKHIVLRLLGKDIELRVRLAPDLGSIKADPTQVEQVILNLVVNARDAMPKGGTLTVQTQAAFVDEAGARAPMKPGAHVVLSVSDTGTGMDAKTKERIFEPFFTTKRVGEGTGLGLSTVFGIVKQSGGSIRVDSELGRGTSFDISFPCTSASGAASQPAPP
jgi:PAS domain S-box-containing protein